MNAPNECGIPVLKTGRLVLRPPVFNDFAAYAQLMASPRAEFMLGPIAEGEAWSWFCHDVAQWHLFGHGA